MVPIVHGLEARYQDRIAFVYLDTDDPRVARWMDELQFIERPHFFLLDADGKIVDQWVGPIAERAFTGAFDKLLASP